MLESNNSAEHLNAMGSGSLGSPGSDEWPMNLPQQTAGCAFCDVAQLMLLAEVMNQRHFWQHSFCVHGSESQSELCSSTKMNLFSKSLQLHLKLLSHSWKLTGEKWDTHKTQLQDDWECWSQKCILCLSDRNLRTWLLECNVYTLFRVRIMCCSNWLWSEMCKQLLWEVFVFKGLTGLQDGLLDDLEGGLNTLGDEPYDP